MKTCARCKIEKRLDQFGKNRNSKDGFAYYCRECAKIRNDAWAIANPDKVIASKKKWLETNRNKAREISLHCFYANHEANLARGRKWAKANPDKVRAAGRRQDAKPHRKKQRGDWKARQWRYHEKNVEKIRARRRSYQAQRRTDPVQRLIDAIRRRMRLVINGKAKGAFVLLGYDAEQLRQHLESQFAAGMTWDNYGLYGERWHVDHKRPVSSFKLPEQLVECFALENLQPLWARDNLSKGRRSL